jgi:DNA-directed RNA polymerase specialized sigma24 family protein
MEGLEERARKVVTLAFRDDRSADEIAGTLATTAGNVRVIRHRALQALRNCLDAKRKES